MYVRTYIHIARAHRERERERERERDPAIMEGKISPSVISTINLECMDKNKI